MEQIQSTTFMAYLEQVPDPRRERGKQYEWAYILAIITAVLLSGKRTGQAIAQWPRWHKVLRGVRAQGRLVHLLSLVRHESGMVLAQAEVMEKSNEITAAPDLLAEQTLSGTVRTMDALLTRRALAEQILAQQGHYLMVVKENQPRLYEHIDLPFHQPPAPAYEDEHLACRTADKWHGRIEVRTLESSTALNDYLYWPGAAQVLVRPCRRVCQKTGEMSETGTYGLTSLSREEALPPHFPPPHPSHFRAPDRDYLLHNPALVTEGRRRVKPNDNVTGR